MTDPATSRDLFDPAYERVEHVLLRLLGDPRMADRATRQLFAKLAIPTATTEAGDELRARRLTDGFAPTPGAQPGLAEQLREPEPPPDRLVAALLLSLSRLAPLERQVFFFRTLVAMTFEEIAARLGRSERSIRTTYARALGLIEADLAAVVE